MDIDYNELGGGSGDGDLTQLGGDSSRGDSDDTPEFGHDGEGFDSVDLGSDLPDVQRSESGRDAVPGGTAKNFVTVDQVRLLKLADPEKVKWILERYESMNVPKMHPLVFYNALMHRRDSYFLEVGEIGLVWLTGVLPNNGALLDFMFWDGRLGADRVEVVKSSVLTVFNLFKLERLSARIPKKSAPVQRVLREVGFKLEGTIRRGWAGDPPDDLLLFGMLKEEQPWLAMPLPMTSLV